MIKLVNNCSSGWHWNDSYLNSIFITLIKLVNNCCWGWHWNERWRLISEMWGKSHSPRLGYDCCTLRGNVSFYLNVSKINFKIFLKVILIFYKLIYDRVVYHTFQTNVFSLMVYEIFQCGSLGNFNPSVFFSKNII